MTLPVHYAKLDEITLDDLKFQDLVDEGRKRIRQYCPDWTEYNLSDPGITLLELFAWMTELTVYRLNQVPYKNYIKFLEMLGINLLPAVAATTELTFRLAAPFPIDPTNLTGNLYAVVPEGREFSTTGGGAEPVIFATNHELVIRTPRVKVVSYAQDSFTLSSNFWTNKGKLQEPIPMFGLGEPKFGDALYIGLMEPDLLQDHKNVETDYSRLAGHILRLTVHCYVPEVSSEADEDTQTTIPTAGHNPDRPPLVWEYCTGDTDSLQHLDEQPEYNRSWQKLITGSEGMDRDSTGGFYYQEGTITLFLPLVIRQTKVKGISAVWVRCRYARDYEDSENRYTVSPIIEKLSIQSIGASTEAINCRNIGEELLGISDGEPGQSFKLKYAPMLPETTNESGSQLGISPRGYIYVEADINQSEKKRVVYQNRDTFAFSDKHDAHVVINPNTGELLFGPSIRQPDGSLHQYGRVPPVGSRISISGYRHHAGSKGNVPAGFIRVMLQSIPYIDSVTNLKSVENGRDQETVEEAIMRAQRLMRAQQRAVSATDFETITLAKFGLSVLKEGIEHPKNKYKIKSAQFEDGSIVRVKCLTPDDYNLSKTNVTPIVAAGTVDLLIVQAIKNPNKPEQWIKLAPETSLKVQIQNHLQQYSLIARSVNVRHPFYRAVKVTLEATRYGERDSRKDASLEEQILLFLHRYFSPLPYGTQNGEEVDYLPPIVRDNKWQGWNFGEPLSEERVRGLLREIEGIKYIDKLTISFADLESLDVSKNRPVLITIDHNNSPTNRPDVLLCSYQHEIRIRHSN